MQNDTKKKTQNKRFLVTNVNERKIFLVLDNKMNRSPVHMIHFTIFYPDF